MPFVWTPLERDCVGRSTTFGAAGMFWRVAERVGGGGGPWPFMATGGSYDSIINDMSGDRDVDDCRFGRRGLIHWQKRLSHIVVAAIAGVSPV